MSIGRDLMPLHERPVWRGRMHAWAFAAAVPAGIVLIAVSERAAARTSAAIYAATLAVGLRHLGGVSPPGQDGSAFGESCNALITR